MRDEIQFGDLVSYNVNLESDAIFHIYGRVIGRLSANSSTWLGSNNQYRYLVKTFIDIPKDDMNIDWSIKGDHVDIIHRISEKTLHLDWGNYPSKIKSYLATVDEDELVIVIDNSSVKFFRDAGNCSRCGNAGEWISLGLICPYHGRIAG